MSKKILVVAAILVAVLVAVAILVTNSKYGGPRGAATGDAGGCGGEPAGEELDDEEEVDFVAVVDPAAPAQIVYRQTIGGATCLVVTIEPGDQVASIDDLCVEGHVPQVVDLDDAQAKAVLDGYDALKAAVCTGDSCPEGERLEVLTVDEDQLLLPYQSPLKESFQQVLSAYQGAEVEGDGEEPAAAAAPVLELILKPEQGAVFANHAVVTEASPLKVDLICYASSKTVDMQAGAGPTMAKQKHLLLFRTPGGTVAKFGSLGEMPDAIPGDDDRDMVHNAEAQHGFVIENNLSQGFTRVYVKEAGPSQVVLQYQAVE